MIGILLIVAAGTLVALANISLKQGLTQVNSLLSQTSLTLQGIRYLAGNIYIWLGMLGLGLGFVFWMAGMARTQLSSAYPLFVGVEYTLIMFLSWLILTESFTPVKIAGIILVFIGIIIIAR